MRFAALAIALTTLLFAACGGDDDEEGSSVTESRSSVAATVVDEPTASPTMRPSPIKAPTPIPETREVTIEKFGFTLNDRGTSVSWGAVIRNAAGESMASRITAQVAFYSVDGVVVGSTSESIAGIWPGETTGISSTTSVNGTPAEMRVQLRPDEWFPSAGLSPLTVRNVAFAIAQYSGPEATGEIASVSSKDLESVKLVAVFTDGSGNVVGGGFTYQDFVPAGGSAAFKISGFTDLPTAVAAEVYAQVSFLTLSALD